MKLTNDQILDLVILEITHDDDGVYARTEHGEFIVGWHQDDWHEGLANDLRSRLQPAMTIRDLDWYDTYEDAEPAELNREWVKDGGDDVGIEPAEEAAAAPKVDLSILAAHIRIAERDVERGTDEVRRYLEYIIRDATKALEALNDRGLCYGADGSNLSQYAATLAHRTGELNEARTRLKAFRELTTS